MKKTKELRNNIAQCITRDWLQWGFSAKLKPFRTLVHRSGNQV